MPVLGIDFGTSNSAAALVDAHGQLQVIALDSSRDEMPTAVFFCQETQRVLFGAQAMAEYLSGTEGRLLRSLKSLLGSALMDEYTAVGERSVRFFDIVVLFFKELRRRAEAQTGLPLTHAVLGRPVHFVDDSVERDNLAQATLGRAAREAGFTHIAYQFEPIAAALDYERRLQGETTALVVDIGGGTSDFTVIRLNPARSAQADRRADVLATTGVHIGGTDFDRLLDLACAMPLLGYKHLGPRGRPVPSSVFFDLSTWHLIHQTTTRKALLNAKELWTDYADLTLHRRLMTVLEQRSGHHLLAEVERAKIACSVTGAAQSLDLGFVERDLCAALPTALLEQALQSAIGQVVACAMDCVRASGQNRVDAVYLTGGSSALRPLIAALQTAMPESSLVQGNRFGGVAAGLGYCGATAAFESL